MKGNSIQTPYQREGLSLIGVAAQWILGAFKAIALFWTVRCASCKMGWPWHAMEQVRGACHAPRCCSMLHLSKPHNEGYRPSSLSRVVKSRVKDPRCSRVRDEEWGVKSAHGCGLGTPSRTPKRVKLITWPGGYCPSRFRDASFDNLSDHFRDHFVSQMWHLSPFRLLLLNSISIRIGKSWGTHFWHILCHLSDQLGARKVAESGYHFWNPLLAPPSRIQPSPTRPSICLRVPKSMILGDLGL